MEKQTKHFTTIADYARSHGISSQAVSQQIQRFSEHLEGHVTVDGRRKYLDEFAVEYLDSHRLSSTLVVTDQRTVDRVEALEAERNELKDLIIHMQQQIDGYKDNLRQLETESVKQIADTKVAEEKLKATEEKLKAAEETAERNWKTLEAEIEAGAKTREQLRAAEEVAAQLRSDAEAEKQRASAELEALRKELEEEKAARAAAGEKIEKLRNRGFFARLFNSED